MDPEDDGVEDAPSLLHWEKNYGRVWAGETDDLDAFRNLRPSADAQGDDAGARLQRGMLRWVVLVIDASKSSALEEVGKQLRLSVMVAAAKSFVDAFHDENPLSNLAIVTSHSSLAHKVSDLSRSALAHRQALDKLQEGVGAFSVHNSLKLSLAMLKNVPSFASKEIIILASALSSVDPGDVYLVLEEVKQAKVRVSVVHYCAAVELHRRLAERTQGKMTVALSPAHLSELLAAHLRPPPVTGPTLSSMVLMGFPSQRVDSTVQPAYCSDVCDVIAAPFFCPRCMCAVSTYPATCRVCQLPLIAAANLARSYHHLFPVPMFEHAQAERCFGCECALDTQQGGMACPKCQSVFCADCDRCIHDTLFNCPLCAAEF